LDLTVDAVVGVSVLPVDLPRLGGDDVGVPNENEFLALIVEDRLGLLLHRAGLPGRLLGSEPLLDDVVEDDLLPAATAEDVALLLLPGPVNDGLVAEGLFALFAHVVPDANAIGISGFQMFVDVFYELEARDFGNVSVGKDGDRALPFVPGHL